MGGVIVGLIAIGIGILLIYLRKQNQGKLLDIKFVKTSTAQELQEMCAAIKESMSQSGGFKQQSEVKGLVKCDKPLHGELSKKLCVFYEMNVEERYEETYYETDQQGNRHRKTRTGTTSVASNSQRIPFYVQDATGKILVNPEGADLEGTQVVSKYEQNFSAGRVSFGGFSLSVSAGSGDRRVLGYQFTEKILEVDRNVYVLGDAADTSGSLQMQMPDEKGKPYIITYKSEEQLTCDTESSINMMMYGAIACFIIGACAIVYGLMAK